MVQISGPGRGRGLAGVGCGSEHAVAGEVPGRRAVEAGVVPVVPPGKGSGDAPQGITCEEDQEQRQGSASEPTILLV